MVFFFMLNGQKILAVDFLDVESSWFDVKFNSGGRGSYDGFIGVGRDVVLEVLER